MKFKYALIKVFVLLFFWYSTVELDAQCDQAGLFPAHAQYLKITEKVTFNSGKILLKNRLAIRAPRPNGREIVEIYQKSQMLAIFGDAFSIQCKNLSAESRKS